ncbi:Os01g0290800 [Oryza sativa Japonica Group]|uniref:Os01g0290800 protein n=2 Tax=Oryza sativa subsp. japonica TaxID=39947 RepID=C7IWP8_ORYSJ|nr:hypothetical protein EE612_001936 [Oryza sativa]BAH91017.1 Os01g0290800 [Oryza sativa Japonica Group]BAS71656.1 Os01g0290800 [Oryza sativa Japonica Group]|eukprot:NP_001172287.1 Os01g0290800 [Oryza sativa Japonica Group]
MIWIVSFSKHKHFECKEVLVWMVSYLPRMNCQAQVSEYLNIWPGWISEANMLELNIAVQCFDSYPCILTWVYPRFTIHNCKYRRHS